MLFWVIRLDFRRALLYMMPILVLDGQEAVRARGPQYNSQRKFSTWQLVP
jgi:hypothetical protein